MREPWCARGYGESTASRGTGTRAWQRVASRVSVRSRRQTATPVAATAASGIPTIHTTKIAPSIVKCPLLFAQSASFPSFRALQGKGLACNGNMDQ
jgi:hypothetical protein